VVVLFFEKLEEKNPKLIDVMMQKVQLKVGKLIYVSIHMKKQFNEEGS